MLMLRRAGIPLSLWLFSSGILRTRLARRIISQRGRPESAEQETQTAFVTPINCNMKPHLDRRYDFSRNAYPSRLSIAPVEETIAIVTPAVVHGESGAFQHADESATSATE